MADGTLKLENSITITKTTLICITSPLFFPLVDRTPLVVPSSKCTSCHCPLHFICWYLLQFLMAYKNSKESVNSCQIIEQAGLHNTGNARHPDPALSSDTTRQRKSSGTPWLLHQQSDQVTAHSSFHSWLYGNIQDPKCLLQSCL